MKVNMLNKTTKNISDDSYLHITLINRYKSRIVTQQRTWEVLEHWMEALSNATKPAWNLFQKWPGYNCAKTSRLSQRQAIKWKQLHLDITGILSTSQQVMPWIYANDRICHFSCGITTVWNNIQVFQLQF